MCCRRKCSNSSRAKLRLVRCGPRRLTDAPVVPYVVLSSLPFGACIPPSSESSSILLNMSALSSHFSAAVPQRRPPLPLKRRRVDGKRKKTRLRAQQDLTRRSVAMLSRVLGRQIGGRLVRFSPVCCATGITQTAKLASGIPYEELTIGKSAKTNDALINVTE